MKIFSQSKHLKPHQIEMLKQDSVNSLPLRYFKTMVSRLTALTLSVDANLLEKLRQHEHFFFNERLLQIYSGKQIAVILMESRESQTPQKLDYLDVLQTSQAINSFESKYLRKLEKLQRLLSKPKENEESSCDSNQSAPVNKYKKIKLEDESYNQSITFQNINNQLKDKLNGAPPKE